MLWFEEIVFYAGFMENLNSFSDSPLSVPLLCENMSILEAAEKFLQEPVIYIRYCKDTIKENLAQHDILPLFTNNHFVPLEL